MAAASVEIEMKVRGAPEAKAAIEGVGDSARRVATTTGTSMDATSKGFWATEMAATNLQRTLTNLAKTAAFTAIGGGIAGVISNAKALSAEIDNIYKSMERPAPGFWGNITTGWKMMLGLDSGAPEDQGPIKKNEMDVATSRANFARNVIQQEQQKDDPVAQTIEWSKTLEGVPNKQQAIIAKYREIVAAQEEAKNKDKEREKDLRDKAKDLFDEQQARLKGITDLSESGGRVASAAVRGSAEYNRSLAESSAGNETRRLAQSQLEQQTKAALTLEQIHERLAAGQTVGVITMEGA